MLLTPRLLPEDLPSSRELIDEGRKIARTFEVGRSLLNKEFGVRTDEEYKKKMVAEGRIMTCMNIGAATWKETADGLRYIWEETEKRGFRIDRFTFQLDRRMGVPPECWKDAAKETGPLLVTDEDWHGPANTVPIQPGMGDMMIGSPMSVHNAVKALASGVYYVGNMSQFSWKYPVWDGSDVDQMVEMVKALAIMAAKAPEGAVVQSYLEDGFCAQFSDYGSFVGWTLFERYVVEDVFGGALSVTWGGLTHNPVMKSAVTMALEAVKPPGRVNAFYHCDTTHFVPDIQRNYPALSIDMLFLAMTEMRLKSGACVLPIPVTEALRVPSFDEIVEVHNITRKVIDDAPRISEDGRLGEDREGQGPSCRGGPAVLREHSRRAFPGSASTSAIPCSFCSPSAAWARSKSSGAGASAHARTATSPNTSRSFRPIRSPITFNAATGSSSASRSAAMRSFARWKWLSDRPMFMSSASIWSPGRSRRSD